MEAVVHPWVLFLSLAVGALGVVMALPRPRVNPQVIGAVIAGLALGGLLLSMGLKAGERAPGLYFYVFTVIALGSGLRVISHPKPVYAALYFILTILSSSALYLMLHAEFLAFALIIIYAGAILITYLFVIMLAEQAPSEEEMGQMAEYDRFAREPIVAVGAGFALLALLTVMITRGIGGGEVMSQRAMFERAPLLESMPKKVLGSLERIGALDGLDRPALAEVALVLDAQGRTIGLTVADAEAFREALERPDVAALLRGVDANLIQDGDGIRLALPDSLREENIDGVGFALIAEHPMALELAGVILLMAMLGAVVLARKQIEISEEEKALAAIDGAALANGQGGGGA